MRADPAQSQQGYGPGPSFSLYPPACAYLRRSVTVERGFVFARDLGTKRPVTALRTTVPLLRPLATTPPNSRCGGGRGDTNSDRSHTFGVGGGAAARCHCHHQPFSHTRGRRTRTLSVSAATGGSSVADASSPIKVRCAPARCSVRQGSPS